MANKKELLYSKDLPIYSAQRKLTQCCIHIMLHCQRDLKHTLAQELVHLAYQQKLLIAKVNRESEKADLLREFLDNHNIIEETIKDLTELGAVEEKYYIEAIPLLANIQRQAGGWFKTTQADTAGVRSNQPESA